MDSSSRQQWQPWATIPPSWEGRPRLCFVHVIGVSFSRGIPFHREWTDVVHASSETKWGFRMEDMIRIQQDGDMDVIECIKHWMPLPEPPKDTTP